MIEAKSKRHKINITFEVMTWEDRTESEIKTLVEDALRGEVIQPDYISNIWPLRDGKRLRKKKAKPYVEPVREMPFAHMFTKEQQMAWQAKNKR